MVKVSNSPGSFVPDMVSVLKVSNSPRNMVIISKSRKQESEENKYLQNSIKHLINQGMLCLFSSNIVMHEFSWLLENIDFKSCTSWSRRSFLFLQIPLGSNVIDIFSWKGNMYSRKYIYCQAVSTEKRWEMWINFISSLPTGHIGPKSLILAPQDIPDISGYQLGFGCQCVKAYNNENPVINQKIL